MNIIIPTLMPASAKMAASFQALEAAIATGREAGATRKEAFGNLCESDDFIPAEPGPECRGTDWYVRRRQIKEKTAERTRRRLFFYGAELRLLKAVTDLAACRERLIGDCEALRVALESGKIEDLLEVDAAMCNIIFATTLCFEAFVLHSELRKLCGCALHPEDMYVAGKKLNLRQIVQEECERLRREWVVMSAAHGSSFRFDGEDGNEVPPGPYLTVDEAERDAYEWEGIGCTVGAQAKLYNVRLKQ